MRQGKDESPAAFLKRILGEKSLQDLVIVAERVYNNKESLEEQQTKLSDRQTQNLAKILLATTMDDPQERQRHLKKLASGTGKEDGPGPRRECPKLNKNQCAYCKEEGHWVKDCPNKRSKAPAKILEMEDLDD